MVARIKRRSVGSEDGEAAPKASAVALTDEERRQVAQLPDRVDFVDHPSFRDAGIEDRLFGPDTDVQVPTWTYYGDGAEVAAPQRERRRTFLSPRDETLLFLRYNYARYQLGKALAGLGRLPNACHVRKLLLWHRRAQEARSGLVEANMGLVLAMAKRAAVPAVEFGELVSEGNMALLRSVEKFDVARGYKFSTYACRAILKSFSRLAAKSGRYRQHFPTEFDPDLERSDCDVRKHEIQARDSLESLRDVLSRNRARLTDLEQRIVWERFDIHGDGKQRTLSQVGKIVGLSNERVRQIQGLALRKLRAVMDEQYLPS